jgi:hypothetical protein
MEARVKMLCLCLRQKRVNNDLRDLIWLRLFETIDEAADSGFLRAVVLLHGAHRPCTHNAMNFACLNGSLPIVEFLHANRTEGCHRIAMDWAAMKGHGDIVKFLLRNRTEGRVTTAIQFAAYYGHLDIVLSLCTKELMHQAIKYASLGGKWDIVCILTGL